MASNDRGQPIGAKRPAHPALEGVGTRDANDSGFFHTRRAADYLSLSPRTLDGHRVSGDGPAFYRFGNRARYRRSDLDAWAAKRRAATTAEADRLGAR